MLKELFEHIQHTAQPIIHKEGETTFVVTTNGVVEELIPTIDLPHPDTLPLNSLDALVKLVRTEAANMDSPLYITIPSHLTVRCFGRTPMPGSSGRCTTRPRLPMSPAGVRA